MPGRVRWPPRGPALGAQASRQQGRGRSAHCLALVRVPGSAWILQTHVGGSQDQALGGSFCALLGSRGQRGLGARDAQEPRRSWKAGQGPSAATCPGIGGRLGGLALGCAATLLSPPQEALFVKLGRLDRRRLHIPAWRIEPFSVLRGRASPTLT